MPDCVVVVSSTTTEAGKTWLTARLAKALGNTGIQVAARKPVQSFMESDDHTDADVLAEATGENPLVVCRQHRRFPIAMAPPMAADFLGQPSFKIADLIHELDLPDTGAALVEGVGGPRSPLAFDGDTVDLAAALDADFIVLVAKADLGVINAVLLSAGAFGPRQVIVFLNRFDADDELHLENLRWLRGNTSLDIVTAVEDLVSHVLETSGVEMEDR